MTSYKPLQKPIESYSVFADLGKPEQSATAPSGTHNIQTTPSHLINKGITLNLGGLSGKIEPEIDSRPAPTSFTATQEILPTKEKVNSSRIQPGYKQADDSDNEYKVFREFKQKESRGLYEEPRRFESPQKQVWGVNPLDHVGHSPDSPFKIFESSIAGSIKKTVPVEEDMIKHPKQRLGTSLITSKKDPFLKAQDALNQQERINPIGSKLSKFAAKVESKNRSNQIFMDIDSEDDMIVEPQRGHGNINKRPGTDSHSVDTLERETHKSKYFKDNNMKASFKGPEGRRVALGQSLQPISIKKSSDAKDSKDQSKKKSTTDIAYLSEYGSNLTMKRYMERKALTDSAVKASKLSSSMIAPPRTSTSMIAEEPISSKSIIINKPIEKQKTSLISQPQSFSSSLKSDGIMIGGGPKKSTVMEAEAPKEVPTKKDNKPDFASSGLGIKSEPAKISSILGGSSIFAKPLPVATEITSTSSILGNGTGASLFANKKPEQEESKPAEISTEPAAAKEEVTQKEPSPKESTIIQPKGLNLGGAGGGDLFKTQKFGSTIPTKPEDSGKPKLFGASEGGLFNQQPKKEEKKEEEPKADSPPKEQKAPIFGFFAGKPAEKSDSDKTPAQNGDKKNVFGDSIKPTSTFSGFGSVNLELKKEDSKKSDTPSTSIFGGAPKPMSTFGSGSSLFSGNLAAKKEESNGEKTDEQPKSSFFNNNNKSSEPEKQEASKPAGLFGQFTNKASSPDANSSPKNEKPSGIGGLFANASNSLKSGSDDNKTSTSVFGGLGGIKAVPTENKPAGGSIFGGTSLFANNAAPASATGTGSSGLFGGSTSSIKTPTSGLFANLGNKEGGSGLFSNKQ